MKTAHRLGKLGMENAFEVLAEVNKLKSAGRDVISFAIGEPDFETPANIKQACINAINSNHTHYGPSNGILPLREAIADYISQTRRIPVKANEVVVMPGGKPVIYYTIHALVDPGDEVIYPNPGFPIYESVINFVGGVPIPAPLIEEKNFNFDTEQLEKLITPKTKLIILNSPQNPTGGMLTKQNLEEIARIAITNNLWVLSDEIYSRIIYDGEFLSISSLPGMKDRTIILDGFSKTYAMTGWRLGYGVMNETLAEHMTRLETNCESCTNTFIQHAGIEALQGPQDSVLEMVAEFKFRRNLIVAGLNDIRGICCKMPSGAFYAYPNVTEACKNLGFGTAKELQQYLLHQAGVAVLPGTSFGARNKNDPNEYLRFSYATSQENILKGLQLIKQAIEK
ncbi:pyridoxal phosphate-dependent aminotransferase [Dendrosporobacter sp. 1207_IL3150]|uniref:pyridoxal phosphate-dependent aminotransferase n=1 Tax=Dendrosporobacter sp. 1207_IL3150 TaxID=3084054 RepID=UPI002FD9B0D5